MSLVTNQKKSLYNGVNQQAAEHRLETQVEESLNAYPTVNQGLLKRNPTQKIKLSSTINYTSDMWSYAYDRGLAGSSEEKYSIQISEGIMEIINVSTGKVYKKGNGLIYTGSAENYLNPFVGIGGYSAVTIKDTTFILNKNVTPTIDELVFNDGATALRTVNKSLINFIDPVRQWSTAALNDIEAWNQNKFAPTKMWEEEEAVSMGSTTTIVIDGTTINYSIGRESGVTNGNQIDSWNEYKSNIANAIRGAMPTSGYLVTSKLDGVEVVKLDGTALSVTFAITFLPMTNNEGIAVTNGLDSIEADYYSGITTSTEDKPYSTVIQDYEKECFLWLSSADAAYPYTYSVTVTDSLANTKTASVSTQATSDGAATSLASTINADANFSATAEGSVVKIVSTSGTIDTITSFDSYGSQASFSWNNETSSSADLPKNLGFDGIVKITGSENNSFDNYWLKSIDGIWKEHIDPSAKTKILDSTMPHILVRNSDDTFTLQEYGRWTDRVVGDDDTNPYPTFVSTDESGATKIKDIFFFKNRLGFITDRTVIMSEVGGYGNFWRTTVSTLLDSDRIDTVVDTTKVITLEYAVYLEDSLLLFSDKAQFKLEGGRILSPKSIQISKTSAYEIDVKVRPLFMNDKVFFCAKRGSYTAVMQYFISGDGRISEAFDITSHVEKYIPQNITSLSGSSINNMLFITSLESRDTIFVYKYIESGDGEKAQSAWFKWTYNGDIYSVFSLGKYLNVLINRLQSSVVTDWILGDGIWSGDKLWTGDGIWYGSPASLSSVNNFERQEIHPQSHNDYFVDASELVEDLSNIVDLTSTASSTSIIYSANQALTSDIVVSVGTSSTNYTIDVTTTEGVYSSVSDSLTIPRNPTEFITSIEFTNNDIIGTTVYLMSAVLVGGDGSNLLFNGDLSSGLDNWTFTDWDINYGTKDVGSLIPVDIDLGEWVLKRGEVALTRGYLAFKTIQISSETGSSFFLNVEDVERGTNRIIKNKYVVNRKPMVYGNSKNVRVSIRNLDTGGMRINSVSFEGNYNKRSVRY